MAKYPQGDMFDFNNDGNLDLGESAFAANFFDSLVSEDIAENDDLDQYFDDPDAYYGELEEEEDWDDLPQVEKEILAIRSWEDADDTDEELYEHLEEDEEADFEAEYDNAPLFSHLDFPDAPALQSNNFHADKDVPFDKCYPNQRSYYAARHLLEIQNEIYESTYSDVLELEAERAAFILRGDCIAAKYLTFTGAFLYAQAAKENFSLPVAFPDEDATPRISFSEVLLDISEEDPILGVQIWMWMLKECAPYAEYFEDPDTFGNAILLEAHDYHPAFLNLVIEALIEDETFRTLLLEENPEFPYAGTCIAYTLQEGKYQQAELLLKSLMKNPHGTGRDYEMIVSDLLDYPYKSNDPLPWLFMKKKVFPVLEKKPFKRTQRLLPLWKIQVAKKLEAYLPSWERTQRHLRQQKIRQKRDDTFIFCGVMLSKGQQIYYYLTEDTTLSVGDKVLIPRWDGPQTAKVVSIGQYTKKTSPIPLSQAKYLIGRSSD
jgi:hypothetical protein